MNITHCLMARAALRWTVDDLASAAGVSRRTVLRFEKGEGVQPETVQAMRRALEAAGVLFVDSGKLAGAVVPPREQN